MIGKEKERIKIKAEEIFRIEYEKALKMLQKKKPQMHPRKRQEAARKIARRKYLNYLESYRLCPADFVEHSECSLGDLV
ncbi:MAG: hypothetical protein QW540_09020 [Archaeoglobaceae archaeon]